MAQEDMNVTIPPEMMQEIVRVASETAIEKFQHEAERNRKAVKDKRLHNTKLLLQNYHCFVEHSKSAVYEASQLSEDDDFIHGTLAMLYKAGERCPYPHHRPAH